MFGDLCGRLSFATQMPKPSVRTLGSPPANIINKKPPHGAFYIYGDLCGSRTRVDGMKTRCTNRYTKRPISKCTFLL